MPKNADKYILLASGSAIRKTLLQNSGVLCTVQKSFVDELRIRVRDESDGISAKKIALHLAEAKAGDVSAKFPDSLILGCDQTLDFEGKVLGKAPDLATLRAQLRDLRGKTHYLHSAAALFKHGKCLWRHCDTAGLQMRPFSDTFLEHYLAEEGEILLSCVGGYRLEAMGIQLFTAFEGDYFTILGLPLPAVLSALRDLGVLMK